jgi:hypothetical protein
MPYYENGVSTLNKVHLDLGFTKLTSRIKKEIYNEELLTAMAFKLGLKLRSRVYDKDDKQFSYETFVPEKGCPSFVGDDFAVGVDTAFMCYKNSMKPVQIGLAEVYANNKLVGYYGFSHRGGQTFKIGDIIYDPEWIMSEFHKDFKKYKKLLSKSKYSTRIEDVIPYKERGSVVITTLEEAKVAAIEMAEDIS